MVSIIFNDICLSISLKASGCRKGIPKIEYNSKLWQLPIHFPHQTFSKVFQKELDLGFPLYVQKY